jgi:hypothetical protein
VGVFLTIDYFSRFPLVFSLLIVSESQSKIAVLELPTPMYVSIKVFPMAFAISFLSGSIGRDRHAKPW